MNILNLLDKTILTILKVITITAFGLLTLILTATVLSRYFPIISFLWSEEIITILFAYLVFYGSAALWIGREHITVGDFIERKFLKGDRAKHIYRFILEMLAFIFAVVFFCYSLKLTLSAQAVTNVLAIPQKVLYSCLPGSGALMIVYSIRNIVVEIVAIIRPKRVDDSISVSPSLNSD